MLLILLKKHSTHLCAHDTCKVFQKFIKGPELFVADSDDGALEELVPVDEEAHLLRALLTRHLDQGGPIKGLCYF